MAGGGRPLLRPEGFAPFAAAVALYRFPTWFRLRTRDCCIWRPAAGPAATKPTIKLNCSRDD
jgi:hypothetical protein